MKYHPILFLVLLAAAISLGSPSSIIWHRKTTSMINATLGQSYTGVVSRGKEDMYHVNSTAAVSAEERVMQLLGIFVAMSSEDIDPRTGRKLNSLISILTYQLLFFPIYCGCLFSSQEKQPVDQSTFMIPKQQVSAYI